MNFHVTEYSSTSDDSAGIASNPATAARYVGAGFEQQSVQGVRHVDPTDDRVSYEASIVGGAGPQAVSIGLGADMDGVGTSSVFNSGTGLFGGIAYGDPGDTGADGGSPRVGFPLSHEPDDVYAARTGDMAGDTVNDPFGLLVLPDVYLVAEKPIQEPYRVSQMPAEIQHDRPWDITLGAWPWTGEKVALQRPTAGVPMTFDSPLLNAIPSPTGTSGADDQTIENVTPMPLTFRLPPEPWDTRADGQFVDSGA